MSLVRVWNKVLLMGDENVGKSSIMLRFSDDQFFEGLIPTIGIDFKNKIVQFPEHSFEMVYRIWDTAGLPQFRSLLSSYLIGSNLVLIVFDVTNRESFESVRNFHHPLAQTCTNAIIALVANKIDLMKSRVVSTQEAQDLASDLGIAHYFEVSAKENSVMVQKMFEDLGVVLWIIRKASEGNFQEERKVVCTIA
eukprot:gene10308-11211_t